MPTPPPLPPSRPSPAGPRVLDVGQCGFDHGSIAHYLAERFHAEVERTDTLDETMEALRSARFDLVLVNRVLDLDGSSGLDLIRTLKADPVPELAATPVMLVSDYPDAQRAAQELGAARGFGKSELHAQETFERLTALLSPLPSQSRSQPHPPGA